MVLCDECRKPMEITTALVSNLDETGATEIESKLKRLTNQLKKLYRKKKYYEVSK